MLAAPEAVDLTPREREIALLAAGGSSSREIAERLVLSVRTVDNHLQNAYPSAPIRPLRATRPKACALGRTTRRRSSSRSMPTSPKRGR